MSDNKFTSIEGRNKKPTQAQLEIEQGYEQMKSLIGNSSMLKDFMIEQAKVDRAYYNQLIEEGFTKPQAMQILMSTKNTSS